MAHLYSTPRTEIQGDIIPTAVMIKNIPLDWTTDRMLRFLGELTLPLPSAINYLYDDFRAFRGMAFATFASREESGRVMRKLDGYWVCGWRLKAQFKRKRVDGTAREGGWGGSSFQSSSHSAQTHVADNADLRPLPTVSLARPILQREKTPPSESYNLLMSYQTDPVEKEKLRKFLARTGDYQEAVDEFAKNRAKETQDGLHGPRMEDQPILEMRPPTPGEQEQIDEMESRYGRGGRANWSELLVSRCEEDLHATDGTRDRTLEGINLSPLEEVHGTACAQQGPELEKGRAAIEKGRIADSEGSQR